MSSAIDRSDGADHSTDSPGRATDRDSRTVVTGQRARFGDMTVGASIDGRLTATGTAVVSTALTAAIGLEQGIGRQPRQALSKESS